MKRREFFHGLTYDLIEPYLKKRLESTTLRRGIKEIIRDILGVEENPAFMPILDKYARCFHCARNKDRKTKKVCIHCSRPMCDEHRVMCCVQCINWNCLVV